MKKIAIAMAMVFGVVMGIDSVAAEMVDIGTGQMEQSEFMALNAMVQGQLTDGPPVVSTQLVRREQYGLVEMSQKDFDALRNKVASRNDGNNTAPVSKPAVEMVDIGTGEMAMDEFAELKRMVAGSDGFSFTDLAILHR